MTLIPPCRASAAARAAMPSAAFAPSVATPTPRPQPHGDTTRTSVPPRDQLPAIRVRRGSAAAA